MESKKVKVKFHIPDSYKLYFTTSVWGGINAKGMLEIHFLHDRPSLPKFSTDTFDESGQLIETKIDTGGYDLVRSAQTGVVMDVNAAKNLLRWLNEKIETWEAKNREENNAY